MCNICNKIGIRHEDLNVQESSPAAPIYKDAVSSSGTLNFNEGDNIIIPSENGVTYRGLGGNDAYIISTNTTETNSKIEIIDTAGDNVIQLINGLIISKSLFTSDAMRLTLSDGSVVTINGADKFTFELSGNLTSGTVGVDKTFSEFATYMGIDTLPTSGTENGTENISITIDGKVIEETTTDNEDDNQPTASRSIQSDLSNFPLEDNVLINSNKEIEIDLNDFFSAPKTNAIGSSDLTAINSLDEINVIKIEQSNAGATIAVKNKEEGLELLDLSSLNIDQDSLSIKVWRQYIDDNDELVGYWQKEEYDSKIFNKFDVKEDYLYLAPKSYFLKGDELSSDKIFFEYTGKENDGNLKTPDLRDESLFSNNPDASQLKIKLEYISEGEENEYIIYLDSIFDKDTEISIYQEKIDKVSYSSLTYEIMDNSHPFFTRDQILLNGSKLTIEGGVDNAEVFPVYFKIRAFVVNRDGFEYTNPEDGYSDLELTVMMTDDDYIRTKSSKVIETNDNETSISIIEDNPGDILLDLSDFNIDPGTAKIKNVTINHREDYLPFEPNISKTFYIDENVLKFTEGTLYDYDSDNLSWINHIKNGTDSNNSQYGYAYMNNGYTSDVRDNDFEISFTYKSNNEEFEHIVKIVEYENTTYGSIFSSDYFLTSSNLTTDNVFIDALNTRTRLPHLKSEKESYLMKESEWSNYETTITYSFLDPNKEEFHSLGKFGEDVLFNPYSYKDTAHSYNDIGKNMIRDILDKTSEIFKITFEEVDTDIAQIKFSLYTSTSTGVSYNYASYPSNSPGNHVLIGNEDTFKDASWLSINPNGNKYYVALHELGHNLGLSHPFDGFNFDRDYADSYYANTLFTTMAYASFWSKDLDIYELEPQSGQYDSKVFSISGITKESLYGPTTDYIITQENWGRDDILTLGYMYGLRDNYNNDDSIYIFHEEENIFTTIHDMGGYDTLDLSNYSWNMEIDLNPGGVSEVGTNQERLHWNNSKGEKTGDVFILSWETVIEKYIGSSGSNSVTLNNRISNTVDLSISKNTNTIKKAIPTDIIIGSSNDDYVHIKISNLEEINDSISINGGAGFDWLIIEALQKTAFENIDAIEISKDNDRALVALKENIRGIEVLDLNFLNIDEGSLEISQHYYNAYFKIIEDPPDQGYNYYWRDIDKNYTFFELNENILSLYSDNYLKETGIPDSDAEYTEAQFYYKYTNDNGEISQSWMPSENFQVRLSYKSKGIEKEYIVEIHSIYNNDSPYSDYFDPEENPEEDRNLDFNLTDLLTHFDNIENFDFTNSEKNTIAITDDAFQLSNKTKIKGDENDEISLPQGAEQTSFDDLYLYYTLNDVEIGISVDLILV